MVLRHYDDILRSEKEDLVCIGGESRVVLIDGDIPC